MSFVDIFGANVSCQMRAEWGQNSVRNTAWRESHLAARIRNMNEIIEISQPAPSSCQERIVNGPIGAVHSDKECIAILWHVAKTQRFDFNTCWHLQADLITSDKSGRPCINSGVIYCSIWGGGTNSSDRARAPWRNRTATAAGARCTRGGPASTGSATTRTSWSSTWSSGWESKDDSRISLKVHDEKCKI